jgi:hypothetical protein
MLSMALTSSASVASLLPQLVVSSVSSPMMIKPICLFISIMLFSVAKIQKKVNIDVKNEFFFASG